MELEQSSIIRIVVIDDDPNIHDIVANLLKNCEDMQIVGYARDGVTGLQVCQQMQPELVLMDVMMPRMSGVETTQVWKSISPASKVLVLSSYQEYGFIREMLTKGASGYLVKSTLAQDLVDTIRSVIRGNIVFSPEAAQILFDPVAPVAADKFRLTERERDVLRLMAQGFPDKQIAVTLTISVPTVRFHYNNILAKFNVATRSEVLVVAAKNALV